MTVKITGIAGSLRREPFNRKLLNAAAHQMPPKLADTFEADAVSMRYYSDGA